MNDGRAIERKMSSLALEVLTLSRNTLLVNLRYLDTALSLLELREVNTATIETNGEIFGFNPIYVLNSYKYGKEILTRGYLHVVLHCIFKHPFVDSLVHQDLWNISCDIAVENAINDLGVASVVTTRGNLQQSVSAEIKDKIRVLTAEKIYRHLLDSDLSDAEISELARLFETDSHAPWYLPPQTFESSHTQDNDSSDDADSEGRFMDTADRGSDHDDGDEKEEEKADDAGKCTAGENGNSARNKPSAESDSSDQVDTEGNGGQPQSGARENSGVRGSWMTRPDKALAEKWDSASRRMKVDLDTFSRRRGNGAGALTQNLRAVNREKYDYTSFLKRFAVPGEAMKTNDEEFDYVFYTYGLQLYRKMPLIEPLEYKEVRRIKEFVIAIDTSGSVAGDLVKAFLQKTYNILKSTESFFSKINLYIIQCDADIQDSVKITTLTEIDEYMKRLKLKGFGGTDFRPVFAYVDELIKAREFTHLEGLIYFTDGYGVFPERKPDYKTAFVFLEDDDHTPKVPPWAFKIVLDTDVL